MVNGDIPTQITKSRKKTENKLITQLVLQIQQDPESEVKLAHT